MVRNYFRKPRYSVIVQASKLKKRYPESSCKTKYGNVLVWKGKLKPTPLSQEYTLRLRYRLKERPEVHVIEPKLFIPEGKRLPHVFEGNELCLYFKSDWQPDMDIAETIIPWASEWLLHYEIWLVTGEWQGGGIHPKINKKENKGETRGHFSKIGIN